MKLFKTFLLLFVAHIVTMAGTVTNFTGTDHNGKSWDLFSLLAEGKHVVVHQTGSF